jgi:hypothetical protein
MVAPLAARIILSGMSSRWRVRLAVIGLVLIVLSLAALAYALWPVENVLEQERLAPTFFAPPQSWLTWVRFG